MTSLDLNIIDINNDLYKHSPKKRRTNYSLLNFKKIIYENQKLCLLYTASLILGIAFGIFRCIKFDTETSNAIFSYIQNFFTGSTLIGVSFSEVFKNVFLKNFLTSLVFLLASCSVFLCPLTFINIFFKGFSIGVTTAFFISRYAVKGVIFLTSNVFLCDIILLPAMILYSAIATSSIIKRKKIRKSKYTEKNNKQNFIFWLSCIKRYILFLSSLFLVSLVQGFISPGIMRIFYFFLKS